MESESTPPKPSYRGRFAAGLALGFLLVVVPIALINRTATTSVFGALMILGLMGGPEIIAVLIYPFFQPLAFLPETDLSGPDPKLAELAPFRVFPYSPKAFWYGIAIGSVNGIALIFTLWLLIRFGPRLYRESWGFTGVLVLGGLGILVVMAVPYFTTILATILLPAPDVQEQIPVSINKSFMQTFRETAHRPATKNETMFGCGLMILIAVGAVAAGLTMHSAKIAELRDEAEREMMSAALVKRLLVITRYPEIRKTDDAIVIGDKEFTSRHHFHVFDELIENKLVADTGGGRFALTDAGKDYAKEKRRRIHFSFSYRFGNKKESFGDPIPTPAAAP